ncbi:MAG: acyl-CoA dehydrogenase family protein [Elainellaceae cyanobacterium]
MVRYALIIGITHYSSPYLPPLSKAAKDAEAIALAEQAAQAVQAAWEKGEALTFQERGEVSIAVSIAKAFAIKVGLTITNHVFDVMGARATSAHYNFDRYWRDLRTFSLHDPVDYKLRDIGNWVLNHELPPVNQYS